MNQPPQPDSPTLRDRQGPWQPLNLGAQGDVFSESRAAGGAWRDATYDVEMRQRGICADTPADRRAALDESLMVKDRRPGWLRRLSRP